MAVLEPILEPSDLRRPFYDGPDLDRPYSWSCPTCGAQLSVALGAVQHAAWSWPEEISESLAAELKAHFRIGPERAHGGGWISLLLERCSGCDSTYALYSSVDEYANSVYCIHIQGLARVAA